MIRRIDLLPQEELERIKERRWFIGIAAGTLVVLLGLGFWWFLVGQDLRTAEQRREQAQAQNRQLQAEIDRLERFDQLDAELQAKQGALASVMQGDLSWPVLLTEVARVIPDEVWLTNLTASAGATEGASQVGTETAQVPINPRDAVGRIQFQGSAVSMPAVSRWLKSLESSPMFAAAWLNNATEQDKGRPRVTDFDSTIELAPKAVSYRFQEEQP